MLSIDLNFLKEDEIESIVSVIEKDFEVKAAENARICKLRKQLINKDHKAELLSQSPFEGSFCVLCCSKFFIIFNPKYVCASCGMQICQSCSVFVKKFSHIICSICQQQQDLLAMNCSWFYDATSRKFMEGGSQIVANSLSEYPKKNAISPYILNMVKGAQITKFRHQIEDASRIISNSLQKVEGNDIDENIKSDRYNDLIKTFTENLTIILHNTGQVLYVTLENYNNKTGVGNQNIHSQVLRILHDEVELLVGKKIDIKSFQEKLRKCKRGFDVSDLKNNVEMKLATAMVEKLISDYQQFLIETTGLRYDDLNIVLRNIVKYENIDFEFASISQAPSRQPTIRFPHPVPIIPEPVIEVSPVESDDSSKLYSLSGVGERTNVVSKKWNEVHLAKTEDSRDETDGPPVVPVRLKRSSSLSRKSAYDNDMKVDSDFITMGANDIQPSNWLMNARQPFGSLNSLNNLANDPYASWNKSKSVGRPVAQIEPNMKYQSDNKPKSQGQPVTQIEKDIKYQADDKSKIRISKLQTSESFNNLDYLLNDPYIALNKNKVKKNHNQRPPSHTKIDDEIDGMVIQNKSFAKLSSNMSIDEEYRKNLPIATAIPTFKSEYRKIERNSSQDSGIVSLKSSNNSEIPTMRIRKSEEPKHSKLAVIGKARITKPKSVNFKKKSSENDSNSSIDV